MVSKMQISATTGSGLAANRRRHASDGSPGTGRALVALEKPARRSTRGMAGGRADLRSVAFLAQLALQYDGIAARRRERAERLSNAISSYGAKARPGANRAPLSTFALKI